MTDLSPDAPYSTPTRLTVETMPLAVIKHDQVDLDEIEPLFDADYSVLNMAAAAGRIEPCGPSLAVYHGNPAGRFDIEIGMPVTSAPHQALPTSDGPPIVGSELPAGTAVAMTHTGPYNGLGASWNALVRAVDSDATETWAEIYVTEPGQVADERLRTDLLLFVRD